MALSLSNLMADWESKQEGARLSNIKRSEQITAIYDEIIKRYEPGGTFGKAALGQLEKQKVRDVGGEMQQMISSGMYGTTTAAGAGRRWEESVGEPGRLRLEDIMMQRLSEAQTGKAGFMERIEEPYPDYAMMAGLMQQGAAGPTTQYQQARPSATKPSLAEFMQGFDVRNRDIGGGVQPTTRTAIQPTARPSTTGAAVPESGYAAMMEQGLRGADVIAKEGEFAQWRKQYGYGATASTMMKFERLKRQEKKKSPIGVFGGGGGGQFGGYGATGGW